MRINFSQNKKWILLIPQKISLRFYCLACQCNLHYGIQQISSKNQQRDTYQPGVQHIWHWQFNFLVEVSCSKWDHHKYHNFSHIFCRIWSHTMNVNIFGSCPSASLITRNWSISDAIFHWKDFAPILHIYQFPVLPRADVLAEKSLNLNAVFFLRQYFHFFGMTKVRNFWKISRFDFTAFCICLFWTLVVHVIIYWWRWKWWWWLWPWWLWGGGRYNGLSLFATDVKPQFPLMNVMAGYWSS